MDALSTPSALDRLFEVFNRIEEESLTQPNCPSGQYLCIRLDGIKVSKRFLKDRLTHPQFLTILSQSITDTYHMLKWQSSKENKNLFFCVIALSDEISFVLNNRDNYFENRTFKIATMLAGNLSACTTLHYQAAQRPSKQRPEIIAFDARPLILDSYERIEDYIRFRYLIGRRNSMCKALRLAQVFERDELYETGLKDDVPGLIKAVAQHGLGNKVQQVLSEFRLFVPDEQGTLETHVLSAREDGTGLSLQPLKHFRKWLDS
jgi:tRNA(His) 5'-end guanylyltransferase